MNNKKVQIPINSRQIAGYYNGNPVFFNNINNCSDECFIKKENFYDNLKFNIYKNKNFNKEKNKICPICLNNLNQFKETDLIITNCNHIFCNSCFQNYYKINSKICAICRKENFNYKIFEKELKPTNGIEISTFIISSDNTWYNLDNQIKITKVEAFKILLNYFESKAWNIFKELNLEKKKAFLYYNQKCIPQTIDNWNVNLWNLIINREFN